MSLAATLFVIAPGAAILILLYLITTQRPDPSRAFQDAPRRTRKSDRDPERRRRRSRGIPI